MKKLYAVIIVSIFLMSTFLAINLYNSTSFPGYGGNKECNYCHNQPAFVKDMNNTSFTMGNFKEANQVFSENNGQWATDEVPTIQTNNRSTANLEFVRMTFIKNQTDIMVMAQVPDKTLNNTASATSDKFGIIFNIDVVNFSVGQFLDSYNASSSNLNQVLAGQMGFSNGQADLWYVDMANFKNGSSGLASNEFISNGIGIDSQQDQVVHVMVFFGAYSQYGYGYEYIFVRKLNTGVSTDAQFNVDGTGIHYAIAHWDATSKEYHMSSFDQMIIVGNNNIDGSNGVVNGVVNTIDTVSVTGSNFTSTYSEAASITSTASTFAIVVVLALIAIAIPIITWLRPKK